MSGGGGGGGNNTTTSYQYQFSPEMMPYASKLLGVGADVTFNTPFTPYGGQRVAGFSPLQSQAFGNIQGMAPSSYLGQGAALAGLAGTNQFTGENVSQYMNPYVSTMQQDAIRNYGKQLPTAMGAAAKAGAFGGSRSAILESEAQSNLQNQLQGIQSQAYESARNQFNTANQNQLAAANALGNFGQQEYQQASGINQALMNAGALQQAQQQQALNNSYNQFLEEKNYPMQQLMNYSSILRGVPMQNVTSSTSGPQVSTAAQLLGTGTAIAGMANTFGGSGSTSASGGKREGGEIKSYKGGGIVSLAGGGSTDIEKMGAINASMKQKSQSMPPQQAAAQVQQNIQGMPDSVDWQNAFALLNYTKNHPAAPQPPKSDTVVVQLAKQIAAQADAKKATEMQQAQQAQQQQMAMQQMQQPQQQGVASLPAQNIGQNYTDAGITAQPQEASDQQAPQVNAASGGGISDLRADNIGNHYADGGIVAFAGEGSSLVRVPDVSGGAPMFEGEYTPNWTEWKPGTSVTKSVLASDEEIAAALKRDPSLAEKLGYKVGQLKGRVGGWGGLVPYTELLGTAVRPLAEHYDLVDESPENAYQRDPNVSGWEKFKQAGLDIAPEAAGAAGAITAGGLSTALTANPVVGFGIGTGGYYGAKKLTEAALGTHTEAFDKWYKEVWLPKHPQGGTPEQVKTAAEAAGVTPPADIRSYFANQPSFASGLSRPKAIQHIGEIPDAMGGIEQPEKEEALVEKTLQLRDKYGIGAAAKNFNKYLDQREAELAGDAKFNKGLALSNFGFKMMSTPGTFAQSLGAGGQQFVQDMMAAKKEENAAKLGIYQARMQAESAIEQGKAGAIDSAMARHDAQLGRFQDAKYRQAEITSQILGINARIDEANQSAGNQFNSNLLTAKQLDLLAQKDQFQKAYAAAIANGKPDDAEAIAKAYQRWNEASTSYLNKNLGTTSAALQKFVATSAFTTNYKIYSDPSKSTAERSKAYNEIVRLAKLSGVDPTEIASALSTSRGPLE